MGPHQTLNLMALWLGNSQPLECKEWISADSRLLHAWGFVMGPQDYQYDQILYPHKTRWICLVFTTQLLRKFTCKLTLNCVTIHISYQHFRKLDSNRYRAGDFPKKWLEKDWIRRAEKTELRTNHMKVSSWHWRGSVKPFSKKTPAQWPMRQGAASLHSSSFQRMEVRKSWTAGIPAILQSCRRTLGGLGAMGGEWVGTPSPQYYHPFNPK